MNQTCKLIASSRTSNSLVMLLSYLTLPDLSPDSRVAFDVEIQNVLSCVLELAT